MSVNDYLNAKMDRERLPRGVAAEGALAAPCSQEKIKEEPGDIRQALQYLENHINDCKAVVLDLAGVLKPVMRNVPMSEIRPEEAALPTSVPLALRVWDSVDAVKRLGFALREIADSVNI